MRIEESKRNPQSAIRNPQFNMPITQTEVEKIADLANLALTAGEKQNFAIQLAAIVEYIDQLNEVDTAAFKPWQPRGAGEMNASTATRDDKVEPSLGQEKALDQAPDSDEAHFLTPRVIG
ncbi:MAG: Asp-tRNA(Asn)/Glu-tRNA(Gln) amidotransferase subunit GatC [Blastocatellia bacterium]